MTFEALNAVHDLLLALERPLVPAAPEHPEFWPWDSLPLYDFLEGMAAIGPADGRTFLDVGAGIATKLLLAQRLGFRPHGIERHRCYIETARRLFPGLSVELADAFEYDDYGRFDVIYCFRPCRTARLQAQLNRRITDRMTPGAMFFCAGGPQPDWLAERVGEQVWRSR